MVQSIYIGRALLDAGVVSANGKFSDKGMNESHCDLVLINILVFIHPFFLALECSRYDIGGDYM